MAYPGSSKGVWHDDWHFKHELKFSGQRYHENENSPAMQKIYVHVAERTVQDIVPVTCMF